MQQTLNELFKLIPTLSPKLKAVAKLILDRPNSVATNSMRTLAKEAGVTPSTVIRLANQLGFERYEHFRRVFQDAITSMDFDKQANQMQQESVLSGGSGVIEGLSKAVQTNVDKFYQHLELDSISKAADLILNSSSTHLLGAGTSHSMASYLHYVGCMVVPQLKLLKINGNSQIESLIPISSSDVILVISCQPYARQIVAATEYALSKGAKFIYLTDSRAAPLASEADCLILVSTKTPHFFPSMVSIVAAIETLVATIVTRGDAKSMAILSEHVEVRKKYDLYINNY